VKDTGIAELSPQALQSALRDTTERLAVEIASPRPAAPAWTRVEWLMARAVATIHGITPLLAARLPWKGPHDWARFLGDESAREQQRHLRIRELLQRVDEVLRSGEVPAIALKGAALYLAGLYRPGERPMADVDILVRGCDLERASRAVEALGFQESLRFWKNTVFSARDSTGPWSPRQPGEHPINIELHERICERLPARVTEFPGLGVPAHASPGLNPYPSRASLLGHLLQHSAGAMVERVLRLIQLHDIALLASLATDEDWAEVLRIGQETRAAWWAYPPLALTARYYPACIPGRVITAARASCPAPLRWFAARHTLSEVSLSFPWTKAFPGIVWARSPGEALEYVARRVVRGREAATVRRLASSTEPGLSPRERRWLAASQGARILRWLVARPARSLTMRVVRSSFGISP